MFIIIVNEYCICTRVGTGKISVGFPDKDGKYPVTTILPPYLPLPDGGIDVVTDSPGGFPVTRNNKVIPITHPDTKEYVTKKGKPHPFVPVTDSNGKPVTDENGHIEVVVDKDGNFVTPAPFPKGFGPYDPDEKEEFFRHKPPKGYDRNGTVPGIGGPLIPGNPHMKPIVPGGKIRGKDTSLPPEVLDIIENGYDGFFPITSR